MLECISTQPLTAGLAFIITGPAELCSLLTEVLMSALTAVMCIDFPPDYACMRSCGSFSEWFPFRMGDWEFTFIHVVGCICKGINASSRSGNRLISQHPDDIFQPSLLLGLRTGFMALAFFWENRRKFYIIYEPSFEYVCSL